MINGKMIEGWGHKLGPTTRALINHGIHMQTVGMTIPEIAAHFESCAGKSDDEVDSHLRALLPTEMVPRTAGVGYSNYLRMTDEPFTEEIANVEAVHKHMDVLMRLPTVKRGAVMPDAMPSGREPGTIPVGGVVATERSIHPGMHSADICCSMAMTVFNRNDDPKHVLDIIQKVTHFGPIKISRSRNTPIRPTPDLMYRMEENLFLNKLLDHAMGAFMTQGDGNHFAYLGHLESTGAMALVTHHGSRSLGAKLYDMGMKAAQKHTSIVSPRTGAHNAWLDSESEVGRAYWEALQLVREWTKQNHFAIHDTVAKGIGNKVAYQTWNEHNFVFQRDDGLFYHAKGATPSYQGYSKDDDGICLIPMNMAEPILITGHKDKVESLGFAPHGAGRDMSRTAYMKTREIVYPTNIDYRFYCGKPDPSELPGAYKSAALVERVIREEGLAEIFDRIMPYGCIMAGDHEADAFWRVKKDAKDKAKKEALLAAGN